MTNEEKAKNICDERNCVGLSCEQCRYATAIKMAEWKDAQFKEYLEKKREPLMEAYRSIEQDKDKGGTIWCNPISFIDDIIDELFK